MWRLFLIGCETGEKTAHFLLGLVQKYQQLYGITLQWLSSWMMVLYHTHTQCLQGLFLVDYPFTPAPLPCSNQFEQIWTSCHSPRSFNMLKGKWLVNYWLTDGTIPSITEIYLMVECVQHIQHICWHCSSIQYIYIYVMTRRWSFLHSQCDCCLRVSCVWWTIHCTASKCVCPIDLTCLL